MVIALIGQSVHARPVSRSTIVTTRAATRTRLGRGRSAITSSHMKFLVPSYKASKPRTSGAHLGKAEASYHARTP
jgi:hypothetical protein